MFRPQQLRVVSGGIRMAYGITESQQLLKVTWNPKPDITWPMFSGLGQEMSTIFILREHWFCGSHILFAVTQKVNGKLGSSGPNSLPARVLSQDLVW